MATPQPEFVTFLISELSEVRAIASRRFFGGWQLLAEGRQFAIIMKGTLFFRVQAALQKELVDNGSHPFAYTKSDRQIIVSKYMSAPDDALDDLDLLRDWVQRVIAAT